MVTHVYRRKSRHPRDYCPLSVRELFVLHEVDLTPGKVLDSGELAAIDEVSANSSLARLNYHRVDEAEPAGDASVELPSGRLVMVHEHGSYWVPGTYQLFWLERAPDSPAVLAEFLEAAELSDDCLMWSVFDSESACEGGLPSAAPLAGRPLGLGGSNPPTNARTSSNCGGRTALKPWGWRS